MIGTLYRYARSDSFRLALIWCLSASTAIAEPLFSVIGDYGTGSTNEGAVSSLVNGWNPDLVITTGDNRYSTAEYDETVGQFYCDFLSDAGSGINCAGGNSTNNAFFPSLGNHDYDDGGGLNEYLTYFNLPGSGINSSNTSGNERYYDFINGSVHFFVIDSDGALNSSADRTEQMNWLQEQLSNSITPWQIVYFHHTVYSSSSVHGSNPAMQWPFALWGADAVISGHDHVYERIFADGIVYFVNGLGGNTIYGFGTPIPGSQARYNDNFGAMRVNADETAITFEFIDIQSSIIDSYSITPSTDIDPPTVPGNVIATAISSNRVDVSWDASTDQGGGVVVGYRVYRSDIGLVGTVTGARFQRHHGGAEWQL